MKQKFFVSGIIASILAILYLLSFSKKKSVEMTYEVQRPIQQRFQRRVRHTLPKQPITADVKKVVETTETVKPLTETTSFVTPPLSVQVPSSVNSESDIPSDFAAKLDIPSAPNVATAFSTAALVRSRPRRLAASNSAKQTLPKISESVSRKFTSIQEL
jgi:hypothetical protein